MYTQPLSYTQKDASFAKCEQMLSDYSATTLAGSRAGSKRNSVAEVGQLTAEMRQCGWTEIMCGVVAVFMRMDSVL